MNKQQLKSTLRQLKTPDLLKFYKWKLEKDTLEKITENFYLNNREFLLGRIIKDFYMYPTSTNHKNKKFAYEEKYKVESDIKQWNLIFDSLK